MTTSRTLAHVWSQTVAAAPSAPAVIEAATDTVHTRHGLAAAASAATAQLPLTLRGRRVIVVEANGPRWFERVLALIQLGAVPVPLDPTEPELRQLEIGRRLGAAAIWNARGLQQLDLPARSRRETAALIKVTSGSTGNPSALRFTAEQLLADGRNVCTTMGIRPDDVNLAVIPCGHSYALGNMVLPLLQQGTALLVPRAPLPRVLGEDCIRWRPTVFPAVPALLKLLAESELDGAALGSLRTIISAGSPLAPAIAQTFRDRFGQEVHGFYGSSETGGITYDRSGDATLAGRSVGTALDGVTLHLGRGRRLIVESEAVATLGRRQRAANGAGRHSPADRVRMLANGELILDGRSGRMVKLAGRRLDLSELDGALRQVPGVTDAWSMPHPQLADQLAAALQTGLPEREIRSRLSQRLPAWQIPRRLWLQPQLPRNARGKLDTTVLRTALAAPRGA